MSTYKGTNLSYKDESFFHIASILFIIIGISLISFSFYNFLSEQFSIKTVSTNDSTYQQISIELASLKNTSRLNELEKTTSNPNFELYLVKSGDTLSSIAKMYNVSLTELINFNNINNPNLLYPNDKIQIPILNEEKPQVRMSSIVSLTSNDYLKYDLRSLSNLTDVELNKFLQGTPLAGLGGVFLLAESTYKVNAKYLMAHAIHESNWGKSKIASDKNNIFGFKAYDENPYENALYFKSFADSIDYTAKYIANNYLSEDGKYYGGPNLLGMNKYYATSNGWSYEIAKIMESFDKKIINNQG